MKTGRNGRIEFFRFVFAVIVMIFHGKNVMDDGKIRIMFSGRLGVEFFFLVSGYLMAAAIAKIIERGENFSVSRESEKFLLKNFCRYIRWLWFHFASTSYSLVVSKNNLFWG